MVRKDVAAGGNRVPTSAPEPDYVTDEADLIVNRETGEIVDDTTYLTASPANTERPTRSITGLDGKAFGSIRGGVEGV